MYSFYKAYWLDDQLELVQKFNYIPPVLERMLKSYLFSSYYLSRDINGSKFNEMYEKEKVKINKVAEWSLGWCRKNNLLSERYKNKFRNNSDNKRMLYVEMDIEELIEKNYVLIKRYTFILSRSKFLTFLTSYDILKTIYPS
jgi:hypothetical protein